jgi:hypothetical protein
MKILLAFLIYVGAISIQAQIIAQRPEDAGPDFKFQGDYLGKVETVSPVLGVQVVAKGGGKFVAAFLLGGLPGEGWDGKSRIEQSGTTQTGGVTFSVSDPTKEYTASISSDGQTLSGKTSKGELFTLLKTVRTSPTLGAPPPPKAITIFNGTDLSAFVANTAVLKDSLLLPTGTAATGAITKQTFGNFTMHLEFRVPFMPDNSDQGRGNSGIYLQEHYELQILDSYGLNIERKGTTLGPMEECGAFFQMVRPKLNMNFPPLAWQTYDIDFQTAKFDPAGKTLIDQAVVTVRFNGVLIHENQKLANNTLLGLPVTAANGAMRFQYHGDPVYYRNIWIVENTGSGIKPKPSKRSPSEINWNKSENQFPNLFLISGRKTNGNLSSGYYLFPDQEIQPLLLWRR